MVARPVRGQAQNSVGRSALVRITKVRCRSVTDEQDHSDKVRVKKYHSPGQEQQAPVIGTENSTSTAQAGARGPGLSLNGFLGPWRSQVRLPRAIKACPQVITVIKVSPIKTPISLSRKAKK